MTIPDMSWVAPTTSFTTSGSIGQEPLAPQTLTGQGVPLKPSPLVGRARLVPDNYPGTRSAASHKPPVRDENAIAGATVQTITYWASVCTWRR
jgi:hypothetical protein